MRVLILCNDFPPLNSIGADRPYSWYKYFFENGIYPIVIAKDWEGKLINKKQHYIVDDELKTGTLIRAKSRILLPELLLTRFGLNKMILLRKALSFVFKLLSFHFPLFDQQLNIYRAAKDYLKNNSVDFIIATGEPFILFKYGNLLSSKFGIKWISDFRDGWYFNHVTSLKKDLFSKIIRKNELYFEKKWIKSASAISTVDTILKEKLEKFHRKKGFCIYNGFWEYYNGTNTNTSTKLILTHTGTLTIGQRVEFLLDSLCELIVEHKISTEDFEIRFVGINYFPDQKLRVDKYKEVLEDALVTTERVGAREAINFNLNSDFLLNFTEKINKAIYAKTYTYIACNRPILVLPDDNSLLGNLVRENKLGYTFLQKEELKEFLRKKIIEKKTGILITNLIRNKNLDFFKRSNQAKIFTITLKKLLLSKDMV